MDWSKANAREPPKLSENDDDASEVYDHETYLPVVPVAIPTQPDLNTELLKAYSLLQHYEVALSHITLDQNELSEQTKYRTYINTVTLEIENLLCRLLIDITGQGLSPDFNTRHVSAEKIVYDICLLRTEEGRLYLSIIYTYYLSIYLADPHSYCSLRGLLQKLASEIYRRESNPGRRETRDFVFLRDTRAGLQYIQDTFSVFL